MTNYEMDMLCQISIIFIIHDICADQFEKHSNIVNGIRKGLEVKIDESLF